MSNQYRDNLTRLLKQASPDLVSSHEWAFKNVFGASGAYVDGAIFASSGRFGIALRLPPYILEALLKEEGVEPFRYFPKGHIKNEYALLPERLLADGSRFNELLMQSIAYATSRGAVG